MYGGLCLCFCVESRRLWYNAQDEQAQKRPCIAGTGSLGVLRVKAVYPVGCCTGANWPAPGEIHGVVCMRTSPPPSLKKNLSRSGGLMRHVFGLGVHAFPSVPPFCSSSPHFLSTTLHRLLPSVPRGRFMGLVARPSLLWPTLVCPFHLLPSLLFVLTWVNSPFVRNRCHNAITEYIPNLDADCKIFFSASNIVVAEFLVPCVSSVLEIARTASHCTHSFLHPGTAICSYVLHHSPSHRVWW